MKIRLLLLISYCLCNACTTQNTTGELSESSEATTTPSSITDSLGNRILLADLDTATGRFDYTKLGLAGVPESAKYLHELARELGSAGELDKVINTLQKAHQQAPQWPAPIYDLAHTYLLLDDTENALKYYRLTDQLAPRGFFASKTAVHTLEREVKGDLKKGIYRAFVSLESVQDPMKKLKMLEALTTQIPTFAPGWKDYANLVQGKLRTNAIDAGLSVDCDIETEGILLINKAILLKGDGDQKAANELLMHVIFNPQSTLGNIEIAKVVLKKLNTVVAE